MLANSSIYRRVGFNVTQTDEKLYDMIGEGMGYPEPADTIGHDVWFEGILGSDGGTPYNTPDKALATVKERVQTFLHRDAP
jgi:hypothetical protein